jgi:hypothetical protein
MKQELITKMADLATYLDKHDLLEESHVADHMLSSLAQSRVLNIGNKTYTNAQQAWRDYNYENARYYQTALGLQGSIDSDEIKQKLDEYFGTSVPVQPGSPVQPGPQKDIPKTTIWEDIKNWPLTKLKEFQKSQVDKMEQRQKAETPGYGRVPVKETVPSE